MRSLSVVALVVALASSPVVAQDAAKTLPDNYKVTFENEYVRVTRVHYPPHVKLPGHTHTSLPSAYVYLNDAGPVAFKHIGLEYGAVTRPPTVARSYRLFRGLEEIHEVENLSDQPSDFLRVEFKTAVVGDVRTLRGKFLPPATTVDAVQQVEFDNPLIRVTRVLVPAGTTTTLAASERPSVLISVAGVERGKASWLPKAQSLPVAGAGTAVEVLRFEVKTDARPTR